MARFIFLVKLLFKRNTLPRQAIRWTPFLIQHKLQNDSFKTYIFGMMGIPNYCHINNEYLQKMRFRNAYNFQRVDGQGLSGLQNESAYNTQNAKLGDFKDIKGNQFVHAVQIVNNPMRMDEFTLDDVESVISDYEYDDEFHSNSSNMSESLVLSWLNSTADSLESNNSSKNSNYAF